MQVRYVLETCLYVDDLAAAEAFYRDVLGLEFASRQPDRHVFFRCGGRMLLLFNPAESEKEGQELPAHGARGPGHVAFAAAPEEIPAWRTHLESRGVTIEREIAWPSGGASLYFRDPAGNSLEIATPEIWD
jgi:catechol 2,3-dioxygenase-like lactoylglutathione lyase family enzyme